MITSAHAPVSTTAKPKINWQVLLCSIPAFVVLAVYGWSILFPPTAIYPNPRVDSICNGLNAYIAFNLAILLVLSSKYRGGSSYGFVASGLFSFASFAVVNSFTEQLKAMVWLALLGHLFMSFFFLLAWLPIAPQGKGRKVIPLIPYFALGGCITLGILMLVYEDLLPLGLKGIWFSASVNTLNVISGFNFLLTFYFGFFVRRNRMEDYDAPLLSIALFSSVSCLCLPLTYLWGPRWWLLHGLELSAYLIAFCYKFIAYRKLQSKLAETTRQLAVSNRDLEQFAYAVSHDLQEPLRMITSYLALLTKRYQGKLDGTADEFIGFAVDGAARMQVLISELLGYCRLGQEPPQTEPVDTSLVVERTLHNLKLLIQESGATFTYSPLPTVAGSESQLIRLFQNLIDNAIKYHGEEPPQIEIAAKPVSDRFLFTVTDNGMGFEQKHASRIFVIFQRLGNKSDRKGTGIGLAACKRIVEMHGGSIWAKSSPGQGTTFYFTLPAIPTHRDSIAL